MVTSTYLNLGSQTQLRQWQGEQPESVKQARKRGVDWTEEPHKSRPGKRMQIYFIFKLLPTKPNRPTADSATEATNLKNHCFNYLSLSKAVKFGLLLFFFLCNFSRLFLFMLITM